MKIILTYIQNKHNVRKMFTLYLNTHTNCTYVRRIVNVFQFCVYMKPGETDAQYYKRILIKNYYENIASLDIRIACLKVMLPDLPIWQNDGYMSYITIDNDWYHRPTYVSDRLVSRVTCCSLGSSHFVCTI